MSFSVTLSPPTLSSFPQTQQQQLPHFLFNHHKIFIKFHLQASRRISNFPQGGSSSSSSSNSSLVDDPRNWSRRINSQFVDDNDDDDDDDEEEEEEDRSLDLLVRFIENVFKKLSKKARKAVRSVLPVSISTKLVGFSVNGVLLLALLWVMKAFLEVVCTLGSVVFVSILLIRGVWSGITYLQESRNLKVNELDDDHHAWTGAQPAT